jgi:Bacterial protein of unknown function (DUF899)
LTTHKTGTREQWLAARLELLKAEKELTRRSDELARRRQELPWVRVDKNGTNDQLHPTKGDKDDRTPTAAPHAPSAWMILFTLGGSIPNALLSCRPVQSNLANYSKLARLPNPAIRGGHGNSGRSNRQ